MFCGKFMILTQLPHIHFKCLSSQHTLYPKYIQNIEQFENLKGHKCYHTLGVSLRSQ